MTNLFQNDEKSQKWLKDLLKEQEVTVTFVKKDGTNRVMVCTLMENSIPTDKKAKTDGTTRKKSDDSLAVFDVVVQEWRSFRWDSVKSVEFGV